MKKIVNPFSPIWREEYHCFGCAPQNEIGLKLQFYDTGNELVAYWEPDRHFVGYPGIVHGGIQATLMDEIAAWTIYIRCETSGVTQHLNVTYHAPLRMGKGKVTLKARLLERGEKSAVLKAEIYDADGKLCSEATLDYYIYPQAMAIKRFNYPGIQAFYEPEE